MTQVRRTPELEKHWVFVKRNDEVTEPSGVQNISDETFESHPDSDTDSISVISDSGCSYISTKSDDEESVPATATPEQPNSSLSNAASEDTRGNVVELINNEHVNNRNRFVLNLEVLRTIIIGISIFLLGLPMLKFYYSYYSVISEVDFETDKFASTVIQCVHGDGENEFVESQDDQQCVNLKRPTLILPHGTDTKSMYNPILPADKDVRDKTFLKINTIDISDHVEDEIINTNDKATNQDTQENLREVALKAKEQYLLAKEQFLIRKEHELMKQEIELQDTKVKNCQGIYKRDEKWYNNEAHGDNKRNKDEAKPDSRKKKETVHKKWKEYKRELSKEMNGDVDQKRVEDVIRHLEQLKQFSVQGRKEFEKHNKRKSYHNVPDLKEPVTKRKGEIHSKKQKSKLGFQLKDDKLSEKRNDSDKWYEGKWYQWYQSLHDAREKMRNKLKGSDWVFGRAKWRSLSRDEAHWYFQRMSDRERLRYKKYRLF